MPWDRSEICTQKLDRRKFCSHHVEDFSKLSLKFMFSATGRTTDPTLTTAWAWVTTLTLGGVLAPRGPAWCGMTTKISRGISATQPDGTFTTQKKWDGTQKRTRIGEENASIFQKICFCKNLKISKNTKQCHGVPWCPFKMRVFHQNESCLLALSLLHNSREDGGKQGSSHFDEKLYFDRTLQ